MANWLMWKTRSHRVFLLRFLLPLCFDTGSILPFGHTGHELCGLQVGKTIFDQFWSKPYQWHLADRALCESTLQVSGSSSCLQGYERFVSRSLCGNLYRLEEDGLRKWGGRELRVQHLNGFLEMEEVWMCTTVLSLLSCFPCTVLSW